MAKFLTTIGTTNALEEIITTAQKTIVLVSPYWQLSDILGDRIGDAVKRGVKVAMFMKVDKLNKNEIKEIRKELPKLEKKYKGIELVPVENLHAKCYHNEKMMLITSLNLYQYSMQNNREMVILIDRNEDSDIFNDALHEIQSIKDNALNKIFESDVTDPFPPAVGNWTNCNRDLLVKSC